MKIKIKIKIFISIFLLIKHGLTMVFKDKLIKNKQN